MINNATTGRHVGKLYKKRQGSKFIYYTISADGLSRILRTSAREYVACTEGGAFFFGRLDLIGAGDHGKTVKRHLEEGKTPQAILYLQTEEGEK